MSRGTWGPSKFAINHSLHLLQCGNKTFMVWFKFSLESPGPSHQSSHFVAIWECNGKSPNVEQWHPFELKVFVKAWAWYSSNTGTSKKKNKYKDGSMMLPCLRELGNLLLFLSFSLWTCKDIRQPLLEDFISALGITLLHFA